MYCHDWWGESNCSTFYLAEKYYLPFTNGFPCSQLFFPLGAKMKNYFPAKTVDITS